MTIKKKIRFILNPFSGVKINEVVRTAIHQNIDTEQFTYEIIDTQRPNHATDLAREAADAGYDIVVAVGGDGSVNEVACGLMGSETVMGILPAGSGNGLAMHLGLGRNIGKAVQVLNKGKTRTLDMCKLNDTPYINLAGVGFDANIAYKYKRSTTRGFMGYLKFSLKEIFTFQFQDYKIEYDDKVLNMKALSIIVANAPMFGYNFVIAPFAIPDNGKLEVVMLKKAPMWRYFFSIYRMLTQTMHKSSLCERFQTDQIKITVPNNSYAHIDGEGFEVNGELNFSILPNAIQVIVA